MDIEINGIKYRQNNPAPRGIKSSKLLQLGALTMAMSGINSIGDGYTRKIPNVDIVTEYGLIQLKKSKLSRNDRDWVEWQFKCNFTEIND